MSKMEHNKETRMFPVTYIIQLVINRLESIIFPVPWILRFIFLVSILFISVLFIVIAILGHFFNIYCLSFVIIRCGVLTITAIAWDRIFKFVRSFIIFNLAFLWIVSWLGWHFGLRGVDWRIDSSGTHSCICSWLALPTRTLCIQLHVLCHHLILLNNLRVHFFIPRKF